MISLTVVFYIFIVLFAIIGALRGWAKEMLVSFSLVLALFLVFILTQYGGPIVVSFQSLDEKYQLTVQTEEKVTPASQMQPFSQLTDEAKTEFRRQFWIRLALIVVLVFFGYQTPNISKLSPALRREKLQDILLGCVLGAFNGFLVIGTIWSYMHSAHYPFEPYIIAPSTADPLVARAEALIQILPPVWLGTTPWIYVAIGLSFLFVLVVFI
jgi:hypothetical protein